MNTNNPTPIFRPFLKRTFITKSPLFNFSPGSGIKVAVIDTGVNEDVPIAERIDLTNTTPLDCIKPQTHGTRVAAIIRHFAKGAHITSIKCNTGPQGSWEKMIQGIEMAVDQGAHIINLSMGGQHSKPNCVGDCNACTQVADIVDATGVVLIAAAGNEGPKDRTVASPAMSQSVISVGLVNPTGNGVDYISSRGILGIKKPDVLTSGYVTRYNIEDHGTSFAAPVITGVLAVALSVYNGNTTAMREALHRACDSLPNAASHHQGYGVLNLGKFVEEVEQDVKVVSQSQGQVSS